MELTITDARSFPEGLPTTTPVYGVFHVERFTTMSKLSALLEGGPSETRGMIPSSLYVECGASERT